MCCVSELVKLGASSNDKLCRGVTALQRQREREEQRRLKRERARQRRKKKNTANSVYNAIYTVGHKKRATLFWSITPVFLDVCHQFVHQ